MLQIQFIASIITISDQTVHVFAPAGIHSAQFSQIKPKMSTSLRDVTMTLQKKEKNGNIFFS